MEWNLPNQLTVFRIILIPVFMLLCLGDWSWGQLIIWNHSLSIQLLLACLVFIIASLTDFLDGHIARKYNIVTNFGAFADPVADKMLTMTAFIILVSLDLAPAWVVSIIVMRELAVTGLRLIVVENDGQVVSAAFAGKLKTFFQMLAIIFLLIDDFPFGFLPFTLGQLLLYLALIFTLYSGIEYFWNARAIFKN